MIVYRYGLCFRPPGPGAVPRGFIPEPGATRTTPDYSTRHKFGHLDYPKPLSEEDVKAYELDYIGEVRRDDIHTRYHEDRMYETLTDMQLKADGLDAVLARRYEMRRLEFAACGPLVETKS